MVGCLRIWFGDQWSTRSIPFNGIDLPLVENPPFSIMFPIYKYSWNWPFQLQFSFFNYNFFFSTVDYKSWKVQAENEIVVENDDHVSISRQ
jgi:hypothetical protein